MRSTALATYVAERHACRNCANAARFVWLPLEVTDDSDHRRGSPLKYKPASGFSGGEQFCAEHVAQRLGLGDGPSEPLEPEAVSQASPPLFAMMEPNDASSAPKMQINKKAIIAARKNATR